MNCPECGDIHPLAELSVGIIGTEVVVQLGDIGIPLSPHEAREVAAVLIEAADLAEWTEEAGR